MSSCQPLKHQQWWWKVLERHLLCYIYKSTNKINKSSQWALPIVIVDLILSQDIFCTGIKVSLLLFSSCQHFSSTVTKGGVRSPMRSLVPIPRSCVGNSNLTKNYKALLFELFENMWADGATKIRLLSGRLDICVEFTMLRLCDAIFVTLLPFPPNKFATRSIIICCCCIICSLWSLCFSALVQLRPSCSCILWNICIFRNLSISSALLLGKSDSQGQRFQVIKSDSKEKEEVAVSLLFGFVYIFMGYLFSLLSPVACVFSLLNCFLPL